MTTYYKLVARKEDADLESYGNDADGVLFPIKHTRPSSAVSAEIYGKAMRDLQDWLEKTDHADPTDDGIVDIVIKSINQQLGNQGWVSVDTPPPEGEWVVARHLNKRPFTCRIVSKKGTLGIYDEWLDADNLIRDPTHWHSILPSLPTGDDDE